jgi:Protein of unknown function (DUF3499)
VNICSKPGCTRTGVALLAYDYAARLALLQDPPDSGQVSPHVYVLCGPCAERLRPPQGWVLEDARSEPPLFVATEAPAHDPVVLETAEDEVTVRRQLFFGYSA